MEYRISMCKLMRQGLQINSQHIAISGISDSGVGKETTVHWARFCMAQES